MNLAASEMGCSVLFLLHSSPLLQQEMSQYELKPIIIQTLEKTKEGCQLMKKLEQSWGSMKTGNHINRFHYHPSNNKDNQIETPNVPKNEDDQISCIIA